MVLARVVKRGQGQIDMRTVENVVRFLVSRKKCFDGRPEVGATGARSLQVCGAFLGRLGQRLLEQSLFIHGRTWGKRGRIGLSSVRRNGLAGVRGVFEILDFTGTLHLTSQPGPRVNPVSVGGTGRDAEDLGRLFAGEPREVPELDQPGLDRIALGEPGERGVKSE